MAGRAVNDEQALFSNEWRMVEAQPRMSLRDLYARFGAPAGAAQGAPLPAAAPAPTPTPTGVTAQITVQQPGAKSVGWADLDAKAEALVDVEAGPKLAGRRSTPQPSGKPAAPPLSRKMKASPPCLSSASAALAVRPLHNRHRAP